MAPLIVALVLALFAVILVASSVRVVRQARVGIVERRLIELDRGRCRDRRDECREREKWARDALKGKYLPSRARFGRTAHRRFTLVERAHTAT